MKAAYGDIRLAPENPIDYQLLFQELGGVSMDDKELNENLSENEQVDTRCFSRIERERFTLWFDG